MASLNLPLLWTLFLVFTSAAGEGIPCPKGGRIDQVGQRCYWLSKAASSWSEARNVCRETWQGDLATVDRPDLQRFIFHSFPMKASVWVWLRGGGAEGAQVAGGTGPESLGWLRGGREGPVLCTQTALGTLGQWRRERCTELYAFLCEGEVTASLPSLTSYLTGVALMTGVYARVLLPTLSAVPDTGQHTVEMQLFPGLWFSHAGTLMSVEMTVQPRHRPCLARVQILRPYCSPSQHLVPPGCSSLLNPFSCCSAVPLCNTKGGCAAGHFWCHLLEACVPVTSPCSPYDQTTAARGFSYPLPPRYPAVPPFYHLVADLPFRMDVIRELTTVGLVLPERKFTVYPDDVLAVQHTCDSGGLLHCPDSEPSLNSPWRQSYLSLRSAGRGDWWEGGLSSPPTGGRWVDGVVCDLRVQYVDTLTGGSHSPNTEPPHYVNRRPNAEIPSAPDVRKPSPGPTGPLRPITGLEVVHPRPDSRNQIHLQINALALIVVRIRSGGQEASSWWSAPVLRTGVPFRPFCPLELPQSWPGCERETRDTWFSSVTLVLPSAGVHPINISAVNPVSTQNASVSVWGYEAVSGLSVEPQAPLRVLTDSSQSFTAKVESGSSVRFIWVMDQLEAFAYEGESYSVEFRKPAQYRLSVTATNPVSSQSQDILLTADTMAPLADPEFLLVAEVVAVTDAHLYTLRVRVDIALGVTFRWDFGDNSGHVSHSHPAPCQTMEGLVERGGRQVYVQDSISHAYPTSGDYTLQVQVSSSYETMETSTRVKVRPRLTRLLILPSPAVTAVKRPFLLEAEVQPSSHGASFTWNLDDASPALRGFQGLISHAFRLVGIYNVTVCADNGASTLTSWLAVQVVEEVAGLTLSSDGPNELYSVTEVRGHLDTGTSVVWGFDFGDGSARRQPPGDSASHVYRSPGNYTVVVTASNSLSSTRQSIDVHIYRLSIGGILPTECIVSGRDVQLRALVNGNVSSLAFHWDFGEGLPLTVVRKNPTAMHTFSRPGIFNVNLTVKSPFGSSSFNVNLCVEALISSLALQPSKGVVAVGEPVCISVLVLPKQIGYQFVWLSSQSHSTETSTTERCFVYNVEGNVEVSLMASNKVSNKTAKTTIGIQQPVSKPSVAHDGLNGALTVNTTASFWVHSCGGTNISVVWDFGDGSPVMRHQNVSHIFISAGQFTITATILNAVSRTSTTLDVNVLLPVPDLTLHTYQPYALVNEETVITADSRAKGSTSYDWSVDGVTVTKRGTHQLRHVFPKPGVYQVRVIAQNQVSKKEAAIFIEAHERIEGLHIECHNVVHMKYIPTRENVQCTASLTQGSNVTFQWFSARRGTKQQVSTSLGDEFGLLLETPGNVSVHLTASNKVGEMTSRVSLVAIERVTRPGLTTRSDFVAAGKTVNISVSVATGSDLQYVWYINSDLPPLRTELPFLLHTFGNVGHQQITVRVENVLSHVSHVKELTVQEETGEIAFEINQQPFPFYVSVRAAVLLHGIIHKGSDLQWEWEVGTSVGPTLFKSSSRSFNYSFPREGIYKVSMNVSNRISWQAVSHRVTVQEAISGLTLAVSRSSVCFKDPVVFTPLVSTGTNVSYRMTFDERDLNYGQVFLKDQFTLPSLPVGLHMVTVKAWNMVSSADVTSSVSVSERITGLYLVGCCSNTLRALTSTRFKAQVQNGSPVGYTWRFYMEGSEPIQVTGQEVMFSPPGNGILSLHVVASNGVCSQSLNETSMVEWPIIDVKLSCPSDRIFTRNSVKFLAKVNGGTNLQFHWSFGDSTEVLVTDNNTASHTYITLGKFEVTVKALNNVSQLTAHLRVEVSELQCGTPQASLVQSHSTLLRSSPSYFEAIVDVKNCTAYKAAYLWEIFRESNCAGGDLRVGGNAVALSSKVAVTSPLLSVPKRTLEVGRYCLVFTVSLRGTPLRIQRKAAMTVAHSSLVAVITGGSVRFWPSLSNLTLDASDSHDPDVEPGTEEQLEYLWDFTLENSTKSESPSQHIERNGRRITVLGSDLQPGRDYIFTLNVRKTGRRAVSATQTVRVCEAETVFPVTVDCVSCSALSSSSLASSSLRLVSYSNSLVLSGYCERCDNADYKWSAADQNGLTLDLDDVTTTSTGGHSPDLAVRPGILREVNNYTFTLNVTQQARGQWGSASLVILPNPPPHGGLCVLLPETDICLLETQVTFNCSGWKDDGSEESQLIYTLQVAPCHSNNTTCPLITLYRGTRSMFGTLVPAGHPEPKSEVSVITVLLQVEDQLGAKVVALNRTLTVKHQGMDNKASGWLMQKSQTELWVLFQHGNPQDIIPHSLAFASHLNQMEATGSNLDLREIRGNVTRSLASLPVSTIHDVDQVSSALAQTTAIASKEPWCAGCLEKVLEVVGKMIHVMEEHKTVGAPSALVAGRNILYLIDNIFTATSRSEVSGSNSTRSRGRRLASATALSALGYAGALMRSLMQSRVRGEEPLSFSAPHIRTVGFHGNPSLLLCADARERRSNRSSWRSASSAPSPFTTGLGKHPPCQFHIPRSFESQLANQSSGVVQIILGMDDGAGSDGILTTADPPISSAVVAMEFSTPQGQPIHIHDLGPEEAIRLTLPIRHHMVPDNSSVEGEHGNGSMDPCGRSVITLPAEGWLNFTVRAVEGLDEKAGLYMSINFSLAPGAVPVSEGQVWVEISSLPAPAAACQSCLVRELSLSLSAGADFKEETFFLSPLLNMSERSLSVRLKWSPAGGGGGGPLGASVCVFSALCQYYSARDGRWSGEGLRPLEGSTLHTAHCLTRHLTVFGASLFVHPGAVVLLPPSDGPVRNMVVVIVCAVLVVIHLLLGLIAHKLDHLEGLKLSQVPLCGAAGMYRYRVLVKTGWRRGAGTTAHVGVCLYGVTKSGSRHLQREGAFQRGSLDQFHLEIDHSLGEVWKIRLWHDNTGLDPSWYVQRVVVWDPQTDHMFFFLVEDWLSVENETTGTVEKEVLASCPEELSGFWRVFSSQLLFGMVERHLWLSLWTRPAHSTFTRGQRVTCSALLLHFYMALGAVWYGAVGTQYHGGLVSAKLLLSVETIAMGITMSALVFPLQCLLCFLFRKTRCQVALDLSVPPSPICHSVEMDIHLGQSALSGPSFLSLPDTSDAAGRDSSPSSLLGSRAFDSGILEFWAASGLTQGDGGPVEEPLVGWPSCDSLTEWPISGSASDDTHGPSSTFHPGVLTGTSSVTVPSRLLRRKKALRQLRLAPPYSTHAVAPSPDSMSGSRSIRARSPAQAGQECPKTSPGPVDQLILNPYLTTTFLTRSEENLLRSIDAADTAEMKISSSTSDSGRYSPRTSSSFTNTYSSSCSCSSWSDTWSSEFKAQCGPETGNPSPASPFPSPLCRCPSALSLHSVASTFLPSPSPDSARSPSVTRIGVARAQRGWVLPAWALHVIYPLVATVLAVCLAAVGLYGSRFSREVLLMWLASVLSAFLASALLLEPLKVCAQALLYTAMWRPVDTEVEELLSREATVIRPEGGQGDMVRPPCGYGLLQAKEEARKVRALRSLMKHCVWQLLFLLLVLLVNYQCSLEESQGRLLRSAAMRALHTAPTGSPNLTSLKGWSDTWQWMDQILVPHVHQNTWLHLVGLPRLQRTAYLDGAIEAVSLGNTSRTTRQLLAEMHSEGRAAAQFRILSVDFTQYHRETGLFVCVRVQLERSFAQRVTTSLSIHPLLVPPSPGPNLHLALTVLLLTSALLFLAGELWAMVIERAQYVLQGCHWFHLCLASLSLATGMLQIQFHLQASSCVQQLRSQVDIFVDFHSAAALATQSSQLAALLLTLLFLKLLGALRFARRWVLIGIVLASAWRELCAAVLFLLLLLLICAHTGHALFFTSTDGFGSVWQAGVSALSLARGRQRLLRGLCEAHPLLGPLYGLLLTGGGLWLLARLCGAVIIRNFRTVKAEMYHSSMEPQDYEMVEFFIKRLKLWIGLTKAKEFRHRVKFEGMESPPSRGSSSNSHHSLFAPSSSVSSSPHLPSSSSALSLRSEDSSASLELEVRHHLDRLLPCVDAALSGFDRVNKLTEEVRCLEVSLEEARSSARERRGGWRRRVTDGGEENGGAQADETAPGSRETEGDAGQSGVKAVRHRKASVALPGRAPISLPPSVSFSSSTALRPSPLALGIRLRNSCSESHSAGLPSHHPANIHPYEVATPGTYVHDQRSVVPHIPARTPGPLPSIKHLPRRRAWHSGSSHSANAASLRIPWGIGVEVGDGGGPGDTLEMSRPRSEEGIRGYFSEGAPIKRKAWISDGTEND